MIVRIPGVGKSHLASALCHQAVLAGHQAVFITLFDFTSKLAKFARRTIEFRDGKIVG